MPDDQRSLTPSVTAGACMKLPRCPRDTPVFRLSPARSGRARVRFPLLLPSMLHAFLHHTDTHSSACATKLSHQPTRALHRRIYLLAINAISDEVRHGRILILELARNIGSPGQPDNINDCNARKVKCHRKSSTNSLLIARALHRYIDRLCQKPEIKRNPNGNITTARRARGRAFRTVARSRASNSTIDNPAIGEFSNPRS
jgi:hypothetical protein